MDEKSLQNVYKNESIYAMGNPYELDDSECKLVDALIAELSSNTENAKYEELDSSAPFSDKIQEVSFDLVKNLIRPFEQGLAYDGLPLKTTGGGLIARLKEHLNFDITVFFSMKEYHADICKIIYFFHNIEHNSNITGSSKKQYVQIMEKGDKYFNLVRFLSRPFMENTGYSFSGEERINGKITDLIKDGLEKEIYLKPASSKSLDSIKKGFRDIFDTWFELLNRVRNAATSGQEFEFEQMDAIYRPIHFYISSYEDIKRLPSSLNSDVESDVLSLENPYQTSPVVAFYFKVLQFEYLGEVLDRKWVNDVKIDMNDTDKVSSEFIEKMKAYKDQLIENEFEDYISKNKKWIAECVFLKLEPDKNEKNKIDYYAKYVPEILNYCSNMSRIIRPGESYSKLLIISCLQALIHDEVDADYKKRLYLEKIYVPKAVSKKNSLPPTAIKLLWTRQVEEHWYANLGEHELYCKLRKFEGTIYNILDEIYTCEVIDPNISEMQSLSEEYYSKFQVFVEN